MNAPIDVNNIFIETERLILRPWAVTDLEDMYEYASVPGVGEMAGWNHHQTIETSKMILQSFIDKKEVLAVYYKADKKVIGSLGIHSCSWVNDIDELKNLKTREIGYVLSKSYWGMELMPETVKSVIKYCFDNLDIDLLTCGHFKENSQSKRVIEKCGFEFYMESIYHAKQIEKDFISLEYIIKRTN